MTRVSARCRPDADTGVDPVWRLQKPNAQPDTDRTQQATNLATLLPTHPPREIAWHVPKDQPLVLTGGRADFP